MVSTLVNNPTAVRFQPQPLVNPAAKRPEAAPQNQPNPFKTGDRLSLSTRASFEMSTMKMISLPQGPLNDVSTLAPELQQLRFSAPFQNVYRNFDVLPARTQEAVLKKLQLFQNKYPNFLEQLNQVDNPKHGEGFQFFFIPDEQNPRWKDIPSAVRGNGGMTSYTGIVFNSPTLGVLPGNGPIKKFLNTVGQAAMEIVDRKKPGTLAVDVGGMFADVNENTYAHEMGHVLHGNFMSNADKLEIWSIYTQAQESGNGFITSYSKTNHMEFFAEAVEAYLAQNAQGDFVGREELKQVNPHLYAFTRRMLEPGVNEPGQDPLVSAAMITKQKSGDGLAALKKLEAELASKVGCACGRAH